MPKTHGLGKGLSSLIPPKIDKEIFSKASAILPGEERISQIPVDKIKANPHQPRSNFDHESLEDLTNSIKEHGILQPLILAPAGNNYQVIAGERRWRAAQLLNLKTVPAVVREMEEQQKLELALVENIQRQDLNPIEEAVAFQRLIDEFSLTQEEVSRRVGKSRAAEANTLRLLSLPAAIQKALMSGKINFSAARIIAGLPPAERLKFFEKIIKQDLTVRAAETHAKKISGKSRAGKAKDPNVAALEDKLQAALGTKVQIKKSGEAGQVIIEFYSAEDLQALARRIA